MTKRIFLDFGSCVVDVGEIRAYGKSPAEGFCWIRYGDSDLCQIGIKHDYEELCEKIVSARNDLANLDT